MQKIAFFLQKGPELALAVSFPSQFLNYYSENPFILANDHPADVRQRISSAWACGSDV